VAGAEGPRRPNPCGLDIRDCLTGESGSAKTLFHETCAGLRVESFIAARSVLLSRRGVNESFCCHPSRELIEHQGRGRSRNSKSETVASLATGVQLDRSLGLLPCLDNREPHAREERIVERDRREHRRGIGGDSDIGLRAIDVSEEIGSPGDVAPGQQGLIVAGATPPPCVLPRCATDGLRSSLRQAEVECLVGLNGFRPGLPFVPRASRRSLRRRSADRCR